MKQITLICWHPFSTACLKLVCMLRFTSGSWHPFSPDNKKLVCMLRITSGCWHPFSPTNPKPTKSKRAHLQSLYHPGTLFDLLAFSQRAFCDSLHLPGTLIQPAYAYILWHHYIEGCVCACVKHIVASPLCAHH